MTDAILHLAGELMSSWWIYLALFGFAALDGFLPAVPSETLVVTAGVFAAATGEPNLYGVIALAAAGAFVGDHVSYLLGRGAGGRLLDRLRPGTKRHAMAKWARTALAERGGLVLVVARYVPGGRTAVTLTMGAVRYPARRFSFFAGLAAVSWGLYCSLVGYLGGRAFEDNPLKGVALGIGLALAVTAAVEVVRHRRRRNRTSPGHRTSSNLRTSSDDRSGTDPAGQVVRSNQAGETGRAGAVGERISAGR